MSKLQYNEEIHCPRCNTVNKKSAVFCESCEKRIHANYKPFKMFLNKHTKDELSEKATDKIFETIKAFLLSHIYGVAITVAVVTSAVSAVAVYPSYVENLSQEEAIQQGLIEAPIDAPSPDSPVQPPEPEPEPEVVEDPELLSGGLAVNTKIFDLFSMNKKQIDDMYGKGEYFMNYGMTYYPNNVGVSYGSLFEEDFTDSSRVYSVDVPLKLLFTDCPASVTEEDIRKTFAKVSSEYSVMDETKTLTITYKGTYIILYPEWGLSPDTGTFIKKIEDF